MHNPKTPAVLRSGGFGDDEKIFDSGPVKSKYMAPLIWDAATALGRRKARSSRMLNADWVASDRALYYVAFDAGLSWQWPWPIITDIVVNKQGKTKSKLTLYIPGHAIDLHLGTIASVSLMVHWKGFKEETHDA